MISTLIIKDFAIISHLELSFERGMTVLTGETGAGKSIIINALNLLLGGKANADVIRTGAREAVVEGLFTIGDNPDHPVRAFLEQLNIAVEDEFVVRRTVSRNNKGRVYIAGSLQSVATLRELMKNLVDISGQHEHVSLLDSSKHLAILDKFANIGGEFAKYSELYSEYQRINRERKELAARLAERRQRMDYLAFQIEELENAGLKKGEDSAIELELKQLSHAEMLQETMGNAISELYDDDHSLISRLSQISSQLLKALPYLPDLRSVAEQIDQAQVFLDDAVRELRSLSQVETNPQRMDELQQRLLLLDKLKRKFAMSPDDLVQHLADLKKEYSELELCDETITSLDRRTTELSTILLKLAGEISQKRQAAAKKLEVDVTRMFSLLAMENAVFYVSCSSQPGVEALRPSGIDQVEFLLSSNKGESPKVLSRIASGGELSRVLLAIKRILVDNDDVSCYVFDEVDTGIGGQTAGHVAVALKEISSQHQVICITHLASIACYGDQHFRVSKSVVDDRTVSRIDELLGEERVAEIARMMGGVSITETTLAHAAEMIRQASALPSVKSSSDE